MAEVCIRPARLTDYEAVLAIIQVYEGFDYLPELYHLYLQTPECNCFVALSEGKVVGFQALRVIDEGTAVVMEAGRVNASLQGRGVGARMTKVGLEAIRARVPSVQVVTHAGADAAHFDDRPRLEQEGRALERTVYTWNLLIYKCGRKTLEKSLWPCDGPDKNNLTTILDKETARTVFSDANNTVALFPSGFIIAYHNWLPKRAWPDQILRAVADHFTLCTRTSEGSTRVSAISFGFSCPISFGMRYDIYYYDKVPNARLLQEHVIRHLRHVVSISGSYEELGIVMHFPLVHDKEYFKTKMISIVGKNILRKPFPRERAFVFEGPLTPNAATSKL